MVQSYEKVQENTDLSGSVCGFVCRSDDSGSKSQGKKSKDKEQLWKDRTCRKGKKGTCIIFCPGEAEPVFL